MTRILIVEDSATQAQELRLILESKEYEVEIAPDGEEGLGQARDGTFDLVLSDIVMPRMTGHDLCRQLKNDPKTRDIPVMLLTTLSHPMDIINGLECGADNYITKPYEPDYLLARVQNVLANKALRSERKIRVGIELLLMGRRVTISSEKEQILDLLISTFEELLRTKEREHEYRVAEEALRRSQQFLESTLDALLAPIVIVDPTGRIAAVNAAWPAFAEVNPFLGPDCGVGVNYFDFLEKASGFGAETSHAISAGIREVIARRKHDVNLEWCFSSRGNKSWFLVRITSFAGADNVEAVVAHLDITARKLAEVELERSLQETRDLYNHAPCGYHSLDENGTVIQMNDTELSWLGYSRDEIVGRMLFADLLTADSAAQFHESFSQFKKTGLVQNMEFQLVRKNATTLPVMLNATAIRDDAGNYLRSRSTVFDITERKKLEEQLRQAQKMEAVGRLAGGVAHDFNNLLTIINGYSEIALNKVHQGDPLRDLLEQIHKAGDRAASLTRQLLAFSRKQVLVAVTVDLNVLIKDIEKMLRRVLGEDIDLSVHCEKDLWLVKADEGQIEQVIMNLVVNARDAMPKGGKLTIETKNVEVDEAFVGTHTDFKPGQFVMLAVTDTGSGMDAATQAHIFEPFFSTKGEKGTGLGLATVYGIVKQSGGFIHVYSEVGRGTTFKLYLPREQKRLPTRKSLSALTTTLNGRETVLLVEDEEGVRNLTRTVLESYGYTVLEARHGGEALVLCEKRQEPIHLMVTDVVMPHMSGPELAERVLPLQPSMKVLYLSGYTDDAIVHHGVLDADTPFLQKPFRPLDLALKVRELLNQPTQVF